MVTDRPNSADPLLDLIRMLRPRVTVWGTIRGRGRWNLRFPRRDDLLFFRIDRGTCMILRDGCEPLHLASGDLVLVRTSSPFMVASDRETAPVDSWARVAATRSREIAVGEDTGQPALLRGGRLVFGTPSEKLLLGLLPELLRVVSSDRARALLAMNETEALTPGRGSRYVVERLMELLLLEVLSRAALATRPYQAGLLAGLADPVTASALTAMHRDMARNWTTAELARLCGSSRSAFNMRFTSVVGVPPMSYLQRWRMTIAKDELRKGLRSVAEIAFLVGFQSGSAFTTAFTRAVGCSPTRFARGAEG